MNRGEIWTVAGGGDYTNKPRPAVIVQSDMSASDDSVTLCPVSTDLQVAPLFRVTVEPNERNGFRSTSQIMVEKVTTVFVRRLGQPMGCLDTAELVLVDQRLAAHLSLPKPLDSDLGT